MKRLIAALMALACVFCMMPSCNNQDNNDAIPPAPSPTGLALVENGATQYQIVYSSKGGSCEKRLALRLQKAIKTVMGVEIPVLCVTDPINTATTGRTDKEIVIGNLGMACDGNQLLADANCENGYAITVQNEKLLVGVDNFTGAYYALCQLATDFLGVDMEGGEALTRNEELTTVSVNNSYLQSRRFSSLLFPIFGDDVENVVVAYLDDYIQRRMAIELREECKSLGEELKMLYLLSDESEIDDGDAAILIEEDESMTSGEWKLSVSDRILRVTAGDYNGFVAAIRALVDRKDTDWGFFDLRDLVKVEGSYLDYLNRTTEQTSAYAYNKQGEYRVIFYNALHHNGSGTRPDQKHDVPVVDRNRLQKEMIAVWKPDVLALQEMPASKRHSAGDDNLITLLGELGYVETIDPRVKNIASREDGGYGIAGDVVTVGNETFRTRYNTVPLLYNKNTTRCLESEYFWFPTQEDENTGTLTASECASKATTWGVFESIETGERYIVVSGHFRATESVQLNQAKEIAAEIAKLVEKYDCPVFLGGDFNGRTSRAFYAYLTEELDYVSMQDSKIANKHNSQIRTTHGYPCFDLDSGIMTDGGGAIEPINPKKENGDSIDKVFVRNFENVSLEIFGVIVDECSLSSSDHLPMVVDFSINS